MESSRTSLASRTSSRTDFEVLGLEGQVLGLGLEASSPRKLACPRLEDSTIFWNVKILWSAWKVFWKTFFSGDRLKNFCEDLFFFFLESTCSLCPWSLALASDFFCVLGLGLEPCVLDSTSAILKYCFETMLHNFCLARHITFGYQVPGYLYCVDLGPVMESSTQLPSTSTSTAKNFEYEYEYWYWKMYSSTSTVKKFEYEYFYKFRKRNF